MLDIDESDQILYLVSTNGTLCRPTLITSNISNTVIPNIIDTYPMLMFLPAASILFDMCNRL
jgi:hypothetical protein